MKFISKSSNYMIVLKAGVSGNSLTGEPMKPGLSVRFRDGVAEVKDEDMITRMKNSDGFRAGDFIAVEDESEDPYESMRVGLEPEHIITEMQYGHPTGRQVSAAKKQLPPEIKKMITDQATEIAKSMVKDMIPGIMEELRSSMVADTKEGDYVGPSTTATAGVKKSKTKEVVEAES